MAMNDDAAAVAIASFLEVGVYFYLAWRLARRNVSPDARVPAMQFSIFWAGLGGSAILSGILSLIATFRLPPFDLVLSFLYLEVLLISAALWGLICYLVYLYSGRDRIVPISAMYAVMYGLLIYYITAGRADGVTVTLGSVTPTYSVTVAGPLAIAAVLLLVLPELVAPLAYFRLFFRAQDRTVRYRIAVVSWGLIAYFLADFFAVGSRVGHGLVGVAIGQLVIILAALVVLFAYYPPRAIRERFGISAIAEAPTPE